MKGPNFYPMPPRARRGILRWIILFVHVAVFVLAVLAYPTLIETAPPISTLNIAWLLLPGWALLLVTHAVLVAVLDVRESLVLGYRERRRRKKYERMRIEERRQQMKYAIHPETRIYDVDQLEPRG